jgi:hypothetical protein
MKRRSFLTGGTGAAFGSLGLLARARAAGEPRYKVSAGQLEQMIASRFPLRYAVADLFHLDVEAPRLRLLPEENRLGSEMALEAAGPALRRSYRGSLDVDFAVRYEARDQSIRAHQLRVHSLALPGVPPQTLSLLDAYGQALAEQSMLEVVLHRLRPRELALADAMGLQPGETTVLADGLLIRFVPKQQVR